MEKKEEGIKEQEEGERERRGKKKRKREVGGAERKGEVNKEEIREQKKSKQDDFQKLNKNIHCFIYELLK